MDELLRAMQTWTWWVGVVVIGLLINLVSAYLKYPLDALLSKSLIGWAKKSERNRLVEEKFVRRLSSHGSHRIGAIAILILMLAAMQLLILLFLVLFALNPSMSESGPYLRGLINGALFSIMVVGCYVFYTIFGIVRSLLQAAKSLAPVDTTA